MSNFGTLINAFERVMGSAVVARQGFGETVSWIIDTGRFEAVSQAAGKVCRWLAGETVWRL